LSTSSPIDRRRFGRWTRHLVQARPTDGPLGLAAAVATSVGEALGAEVEADPGTGEASVAPLGPGERPEPEWCTPSLPALVYETLTDAGERRRRGAWFTPPAVVATLVDLALEGGFVPGRVLDPACGGGAFLVGVAEALAHRGVEPADALDRLSGIDLDPGAVVVCRWVLDLWSACRGGGAGGGGGAVADALAEGARAWAPVDLVVGNPPFASPLRAVHGGSPAERYRSGRRHLGPYADAAACFLDRAADLVGEGGRVVLVLPQSLLASRDGAGVVGRFADGWDLRHLWITPEAVFAASVHVFAPVLERRADPAAGADPTTGAEAVAGSLRGHGTWASAAAAGLGIPDPVLHQRGTLADLVSATSGFRDEHYGLAAVCREADEGPGGLPVVTVGQLEPLSWDRRPPIRFGGRSWRDPVVDLDRLTVPVATWARRQHRPKVLLATQSRVLEPVVDRTGDLVPATPVIAVHAPTHELDRVAAVLLAPPVVAWAARRSVGAGLQPEAVKLAARQVLEVPLPADGAAWAEAAALVAGHDATRAADPERLRAVGEAMCRAYGVEADPLLGWWWERLARRGRNAPRLAEGPPVASPT
jgi:hypothetical protein